MATEGSSVSKSPRVIIFSDYVWPFCYIGLYRADRLKRDYGVTLEWKAFELHPETPPEGTPRRQRAGGGEPLVDSIKILSEQEGIILKRPDFTARSRPALEAAEYAREQSRFEPFHLAVFEAYWQEGKNIGLMPVLREIAAKCGLDADELEDRLGEGWYTRQVDRQLIEAAQLGIKGIPSYIIGNYLVEGVRPYETFQLAMKLAQSNQ